MENKFYIYYFLLLIALITLYFITPTHYAEANGRILFYRQDVVFYAPFDGVVEFKKHLGDTVSKEEDLALVNVSNHKLKKEKINLNFQQMRNNIEMEVKLTTQDLELLKENEKWTIKQIQQYNSLISTLIKNISSRRAFLNKIVESKINASNIDIHKIEDDVLSLEIEISKIESNLAQLKNQIKINKIQLNGMMEKLSHQQISLKNLEKKKESELKMMLVNFKSNINGLIVHQIPNGTQVKKNETILRIAERLEHPIIETYLDAKTASNLSRNSKFLLDLGDNVSNRFHISSNYNYYLEYNGTDISYRFEFILDELYSEDESIFHGSYVGIRVIE
ncbi:hypothetical protein L1D12_06895 [Vibrio parahaemolyticus]|uniref:hypothetical protein n=1 Tax=Vibrio parahaemolyticus TaxID=670 RepID=UPI001EFCC1E1|nr:hypothetical protein [Vibrio parahaemolyticus]MCG9635033.1 hypothetical protein [Vibrio parahaemolyticus]